jgi:nitric oxide dioxygenase
MTPEQMQIIRLSFAQVMQKKAETGKLFYERLFSIAPDTRAMFKSDVDAQARKLMDSLALAIASLRDSANLHDLLSKLGQRHVIYGVRDEHYDKVGEALLWTLEKGLGSAFTPQARTAWTELYATVAEAMRASAHPSNRAAAS